MDQQQIRSLAERWTFDPVEDVESQVVEVLPGGLPAFEFSIHDPSVAETRLR